MNHKTKIKQLQIFLFMYFALGFVFLVIFIPKGSATIGKHAFILSVIVFLFLLVKNRLWLADLFKSKFVGFKVLVVIVSAFIVFTLFTVGHLLAINGLIGKQKIICLKGEVINKIEDTSRFENVNYYVEFIPLQSAGKEKTRVSLEEFMRYQVGDKIEKSWKKGILGYIHLSALGNGPGTVRHNGCS